MQRTLHTSAEPSLRRHYTRSDGRVLALAEYGDPNGHPLFYFHGFPGSRLEGRLVDEAARRSAVRVVAIDRPGYGESGFQSRRRLLDWPDDVAELADALGIERFSVIGVSGGGPYAAACAFRMPHRLRVVGIVGGMGPLEDGPALEGMLTTNRIGLRVGRFLPWLATPLFAVLAPWFRRYPGFFLSHLAAQVGAPDCDLLRQGALRELFADTFREAFRQGGRGPARDGQLYARRWGFRLRDISVPVHLWHGERDRVVPAAIGRNVAAELRDCHATFYPEEGHFSLAVTRVEEMFSSLDV